MKLNTIVFGKTSLEYNIFIHYEFIVHSCAQTFNKKYISKQDFIKILKIFRRRY